MIQDRNNKHIKFIDVPYIHVTHVKRTENALTNKQVLKRSFKLKHELGIPMPLDYYYPEVFFKPRPKIVPNVWKNMSFGFMLRSFFETPLRKFKRRYLPKKIGY